MKLSNLLLLLSVLFLSCQNKPSDKEITVFREKGAQIAQATGKELSTTLMEKMKSGGIVEAVGYCNTEALPITKKMAGKHSVTIKRTSIKNRNPLNKASEREALILNKFSAMLEEDLPLEAIVDFENGKPHFYGPIIVENKCLMCHGVPNKELSQSTDSIIKSLYPNDLATGYAAGDLRGMWHISFKEQ